MSQFVFVRTRDGELRGLSVGNVSGWVEECEDGKDNEFYVLTRVKLNDGDTFLLDCDPSDFARAVGAGGLITPQVNP